MRRCEWCGEDLSGPGFTALIHVCDSRKLAEKIHADLVGPSRSDPRQDGDD